MRLDDEELVKKREGVTPMKKVLFPLSLLVALVLLFGIVTSSSNATAASASPMVSCWQNVYSMQGQLNGVSSYGAGLRAVGLKLENNVQIPLAIKGFVWQTTQVPTQTVGNTILNDLVTYGSTGGYAVGEDSAGAYAVSIGFTSWSLLPPPPGTTPGARFTAVHGIDAANTWFTGMNNGQGTIHRWSGTTWEEFPLPQTIIRLSDVHVVSNTFAMAAGYHTDNTPAILRWNGTTWSEDLTVPTSTIRLNGIYMPSATEAWAVGYAGSMPAMIHWDSNTWQQVTLSDLPPFGSYYSLERISGEGPNDIWAVGEYTDGFDMFRALALHWDGNTWTSFLVDTIPGVTFTDVSVADGIPYAVGKNDTFGLIYKFQTCPTATPTLTPTATHTAGPSPTPVPPSPTPTPCGQMRLADVRLADYWYGPVQYGWCQGYVSGYNCGGTGEPCDIYNSGYFRPFATATRGQFTKMLVIGFDKNPETPTEPTFADVPATHPFYTVIETAAAYGLVSGYACGTNSNEPCDAANRPYFRPGANITRGQIAKLIMSARGVAPLDAQYPRFADVPPTHPFYVFVEAAACNNLISGYACGGLGEPCDAINRPYFRPGSDAVRAQIAKLLYGGITYPLRDECMP